MRHFPACSVAIGLAAALTAGLAGRAPAAGDKALGQYLSSECVTCHQLSGRSEGIPPIIGLPDDSFIMIMNDYRQKKRDNAIMQTIAARLSNDDVAALAAYFGSIKAR